jgi:hypothetical protein
MHGTRIECGGSFLGIPGICGDTSHSQGPTWVDIVGGLSQSCEDHSTSFYGPLAGEWNGCTSAYQQSIGYQAITGLRQSAPWWPFPGGVKDVWDDGFCHDPFLGPEDPLYAWFFQTSPTFTVSGAYATVYDLDFCINKQKMGTIYWPDFTVTAEVVTDEREYKVTHITGSVGTACAVPETSCTNDSLCSDLLVQAVQTCTWFWDDPRTRCDLGC